ncbi:MAG: hypothetical protein EAZ70_06940 [Runella slithyformis]|nr:MAG: hypothetical protein EAY79_06300 [Runella slithyformis]TAE99438.1 MAG: hypothetical protein EAZ80_04880 [Runella slithyformis]TAF27535.1 MAG: hypothetical protein EAZ70_06940 [Runella slithyformis]TAF46049.1 MAG: hypothetical protein EAZ63_09900 [Runella slithyformis]TAF82231.1 MAG: hypothetical protein EAZ50_04340 [Runella slithyformis]
MKKIVSVLSLILCVLFSIYAQQKGISGTYSVSINPKEIVTIKKMANGEYFLESNQGWTGNLSDSDKTRYDGMWQYSSKHKNKKLRSLTGDHVCVVRKDGSITVTITPDDEEMPSGVVVWHKIVKR